ncbi:MAG: hypothetical protein DRN53_04380, partial [Thermoprotei archaeon]
MPFEVTDAENALVIKARGLLSRRNILDLYSYVASNLISLNNLNSPAIELRGGILRLQALDEGFISITGYGNIIVNEEIYGNWITIPVGPQDDIIVRSKPNSVAYINIVGGIPTELEGAELKCGTKLKESKSYNNEEVYKILSALQVPESMRPHTGGEEIHIASSSTKNNYNNAIKAILLKGKDYYLLKVKTLPPLDGIIVEAEPPVVKIDEGVLIPTLSNNHEGELCGWIPTDDMDRLARLDNSCQVNIKLCSESYAMKKCSKYMDKILWLKKAIEASIDAAKRGAKALRVKINGRAY